MTKQRVIVEDIICNIMAFAVIMFPMSFAVYELTHDTRATWSTLLLLPFFMLLYVIRRTMKSIWLFLPAHGIMLMLPFLALLTNKDMFIVFLIFAFVCVVHSCHIKINGEPTNGGAYFVAGAIFCLIKTILYTTSGIVELTWLSVLLEMILVAGYMALMHMKKVDTSLAILSETRPNLDNKRILRFNNTFMAGFILFTVVVAAVTPMLIRLDITQIIYGMFNRLRLFIVWFFSLFNFGNPGDIPPEKVTPPPLESAGADALTSEPSRFSQFIDTLIWALLILVVTAAVGAVVYIIFSSLYKSFKLKNNDGDIEEKLERQTGTVTHVLRKTFSHDFGEDSEERRVRRLYYKTVKRQKNLTLKNTDTTRDILKKSSVDMTVLTQEYESVRYGDNGYAE